MNLFGSYLLCLVILGLAHANPSASPSADDRSLKVSAHPQIPASPTQQQPTTEDRTLHSGQPGQPNPFGTPFSPQGMNSMVAGNMMVGNAMMHPLVNPFSIANPFSPMSPGNPFSPLNPLNQRRPGNRFVTIDDDDVIGDSPLAVPVDLTAEVFDDERGVRVVNRCASVKTQAIEIANRLMKKQNNKIFKELVSYLIKAKFLIGMTEIKLTRSLRKRVFGLMTAFSSLDHSHFNFVNPEADEIDRPTYNLDQFESTYPSISDHDPDTAGNSSHEDSPFGQDTKI